MNRFVPQVREMISHTEALDSLLRIPHIVTDTMRTSIDDAIGRVISQDVVASRNVPATDNAAVDGYALRCADLVRFSGKLVIDGTTAAGQAAAPLAPGTARKIFTGAPLPAGADCVAMREQARLTADGLAVHLPTTLGNGANCRRTGEDVGRGACVVRAGRRLLAPDLAAIASLGVREISCFRPLRLALLSTGNEILAGTCGESHANLPAHSVFDANAPLLRGLLERLPVTITATRWSPDVRKTLEAILVDLASKNDAVITTGGVSQGEGDLMPGVLQNLGTLAFRQVRIKPGRPVTAGTVDNCIVYALPGNPVAVFVTFLIFVRRSLLHVAGAQVPNPLPFELRASFVHRPRSGRTEFLRGIRRKDNRSEVHKYARDGSGILSSLRFSGGLIEVPENAGKIEPGRLVRFFPYSDLCS